MVALSTIYSQKVNAKIDLKEKDAVEIRSNVRHVGASTSPAMSSGDSLITHSLTCSP